MDTDQPIFNNGIHTISNNLLHTTSNDDNRFFENIFNNVNTLLKIKYEGQIIIKMKIYPFNNFTFNINVHITKVEGQVLLRLPSLDNNSKIEYTFISQPKIDISVDAGLSRNEGKQYLKTSLSNFIRRTIRFFIYKFFVYPSFNNACAAFDYA
ncbi:hypothetical protein NBO_1283g0001 [Nosema bombycis CQ1]|uniref:SMP-LTD domain-containing protein n=1 Tax=Nosema bombycis (strain CQ1 / CVCC 102059) TaxID=578461 RepID=R0LZY7_NOSB1|nr:hypothetical protein NBO_1283g0001 [Nosema bombycis CQ1]|eukprot:EOB11329.1 hypothetical protein NBO_1283g0001 [Nosema bombycis CQ1]